MYKIIKSSDEGFILLLLLKNSVLTKMLFSVVLHLSIFVMTQHLVFNAQALLVCSCVLFCS